MRFLFEPDACYQTSSRRGAFAIMASILIAVILLFAHLSQSSGQIPKEPVKVTFWHAMGGPRIKILDEMISEFNKQNPDIAVQGKFIGSYNQLNDAILRSVAENNPPDLAQVYENWTTQLVEIGAIVPMEEFVKSPDGMSTESFKDIVPTFLRANYYKGRLWSLPFNKSIYVLYYNADAFEEAGLSPPRTWKDFLDLANKLTRSGSETRYGFSYKMNVDMFSILIYAFGGTLLDSSNTAPAFHGKAGIQAARFLVDLVRKYKVAINSFEDLEDFCKGRSCMYIETTTKKVAIDRNAKFRYSICPLPVGIQKPYLFAGTNVAIFKTTRDRQKAAWRFTKWLLEKENTLHWCMATGYIPVRLSALSSPEYTEFLNRDPRNRVALQVLAESFPQNPLAPAWQTIRGMLDDSLYNAAAGKISTEKALAEVAGNAERLLKVSASLVR